MSVRIGKASKVINAFIIWLDFFPPFFYVFVFLLFLLFSTVSSLIPYHPPFFPFSPEYIRCIFLYFLNLFFTINMFFFPPTYNWRILHLSNSMDSTQTNKKSPYSRKSIYFDVLVPLVNVFRTFGSLRWIFSTDFSTRKT